VRSATVPDVDPEPPPGFRPDDRSPARRRAWLVAGALLAVAAFGVWLYALFFYDPGLMIDELADRTFPTQAEKVCSAAMDRLDQLPPSNTAKDAAQRADTVAQANAILSGMVDDLRPLVPQGKGRITKGVEEWVSDWGTFIRDRETYVDELRRDPDTRFAESTKANRQISLAIDAFAQVNRMDDCATPGDVG
jgi:hypothetical protein